MCRAANGSRMHDCHTCKPTFGTSKEATERLHSSPGSRCGVAFRLLFRSRLEKRKGRPTTPGVSIAAVSKASPTATTNTRSDSNGIDQTTMQEWDSLFIRGEAKPLHVHSAPYHQRQCMYARWTFRSMHRGGRNKASHHRNYQEPTSDGEVDDLAGGASSSGCEWAGTSWASTSYSNSAGGDPSQPGIGPARMDLAILVRD